MAYYQVNLSAASSPVRDSFRRFAHIDADLSGDHIIVAATETEIAGMLRKLQVQATAQDADFQYPAELLEVKPNTMIDGTPLRDRFQRVLAETRTWKS